MTKNTLQVMAKRLKALAPTEYQQCIDLNTPKLPLELIPNVFEEVFKLYPNEPANHHFIMSLVYFIFLEYKLTHIDTRCPVGFRDAVKKHIGWNHATSVNDAHIRAVSYYKNPRFKETIDRQANEIIEKLTY